MILPYLFNWWDENVGEPLSYIMFHAFLLFLIMHTITITTELFGIKYFLIFLILLTEVIYHIEPRSKKDKKYGRDYFMVFFKKLDSAIDVVVLIGLSTIFYKLIMAIRLEHIINISKIIGFSVGTILIIWIYLWLNRLRDSPKKKVRNIKNKRTGGKK